MAKKVFLLILCFLGSVITIAVLYAVSLYSSMHKNSFSRRFLSHAVTFSSMIDLSYNSFYLAGVDSAWLYLGNYTAPLKLLKTDFAAKDTHYITVKTPDDIKLVWSTAVVQVNAPYIYLRDYSSSKIFEGRLDSFAVVRDISPGYFINLFAPLGPSEYIYRWYDTTLGQNILITSSHGLKRKATGILQKQIDGVFCVDGILSFDHTRSKLAYTYFYRNQFIILDTNLQIIARHKTLDTNSVAKIRIGTYGKDHLTTFSSPPVTINRKSCVSGGQIFINSGLQADNETDGLFRKNCVIDVYDIQDGHYKFSFYLPRINGKEFSDICIAEDKVFAIYDRYLAIFKLRA